MEKAEQKRRRWTILVCLGLMVVFPFFSTHMEQALAPMAQSIGEIPARIVSEGAIWLFGLMVLVIALVGEPRTLASIGLARASRWTLLWGVVAAVVLLALSAIASFVTYELFHAPNHTPAQIEAMVRGSFPFAMLLALRAGLIEEILYRGIAIEQLTALTGNRFVAGVIATLVFVVAHLLHFDLRQLIPIATAGIGFTVLYLWRRNLWINIIAHALIDALALGAVALHATNLY